MQPSSQNFLRNTHTTTVSFAVAVLLFFLPFTQIKCNDTTIAELSGKNYVFGDAPQISNDLTNFLGENKGTATEKTTKEKGRVFVAAIFAMLCGIAGLVLSVTNNRMKPTASIILGVGGALSLIILMFQAKSWLTNEMKEQNTGQNDMSNMINTYVTFTLWFYLCVLAFVAAAIFGYFQKQNVHHVAEVPPNAPQLPLQNPGDQSEFPAAPSGDKDLG